MNNTLKAGLMFDWPKKITRSKPIGLGKMLFIVGSTNTGKTAILNYLNKTLINNYNGLKSIHSFKGKIEKLGFKDGSGNFTRDINGVNLNNVIEIASGNIIKVMPNRVSPIIIAVDDATNTATGLRNKSHRDILSTLKNLTIDSNLYCMFTMNETEYDTARLTDGIATDVIDIISCVNINILDIYPAKLVTVNYYNDSGIDITFHIVLDNGNVNEDLTNLYYLLHNKSDLSMGINTQSHWLKISKNKQSVIDISDPINFKTDVTNLSVELKDLVIKHRQLLYKEYIKSESSLM